MTMNCDIYRSSKKPDTYLYVKRGEDLGSLPHALMQGFGKPEFALHLEITPQTRLARADVKQVLKALDEQGFYLQMPPQPDAYMQDVNQHNAKLAKR